MSNPKVDHYASVLWEYLQLRETPAKSDIIFCMCSHDTRVAERAAWLMLRRMADYLVFSGGIAMLTKTNSLKPEANLFADIARKMGVPRDKIIVENQSSNTGENIRFTFELLRHKNIKTNTIIVVQKPYMERRAYAAFKKQWPDSGAAVTVTSPQLSYEEYIEGISKECVLHTMVGDMQRIREYPKFGLQIEQDIPNNVWHAYEELVKLGFNKRLIKV